MASKKIVVVGYGGQGRETSWLIREINKENQRTKNSPSLECIGHVISDMTGHEPHATSDGRPGLLGDFDWLKQNQNLWDSLAIGIGNGSVRAKIFTQLCELFPRADWPNLIHPSVQLERESAQLGKGVLICANVTGTVNLIFRDACMVNFGATLGHEAEVGFGSVVNPGANISGGVQIGARVLIGTGAQVLQNLLIGHDATVGAGAVVTKNVEPHMTVLGIPAQPVEPR